jgi:hypothetical protein
VKETKERGPQVERAASQKFVDDLFSGEENNSYVLKGWMEPLANRWQRCGDGGRRGAAD